MMENVKTASTRLLGLVMAALVAVAMAMAVAMLPAKAYADEAAVRDTATGVLKFNWHIDGDEYSRGSCFLINEDTVLTAYHCTFFSSAELEQFGYSGQNLQDLRDRMTYSVTINRDVKVGATMINASEEQDFAILKLDMKLNGYNALKIRDSSKVNAAETVFSVGFPANADLKAINTYTSTDVTFKRGTVNKAEGLYQGLMQGGFVVNGYFLQTDCPITGGDSGGPMVDNDGNVVGISVMGDNTFYFAVASDSVTPVLDTLGIMYTKYDDTTVVPSSGSSSGSAPGALTYKLTTAELEKAIDAATALSADKYTEDSFKALQTALSAARDAKDLVLDNPNDEAEYTEKQGKIDEAATALKNAMDPSVLKEKPAGPSMPLIIGIVVGIIALIAIIAALLASRSKKNKAAAQQAPTVPLNTPQSGGPAPVAAPAANLPSGGSQTWQKPGAAAPAAGVAETTILEDEASDTVILFQAASGGSLTRMSTNEQIPINSAEFTIGRERSKVNYCLEGNSSISRVHVRIVVRDGKVYLIDNRAANGTFVNGVKCRPGQEVLLKAGDIITLADEKFKYNS